MRLYVKPAAPSVLRVQIFEDECGRSIEEVEVGDTRSSEFLEKNPFGTVPVLETDQGETISESLTICRYLDRQWKSGLLGLTPGEQLRVELGERRAELLLYAPAIEYVHQMHPMFADRIEQHPEWAKVLVARVQSSLKVFDNQLAKSNFIAGEDFSIADITAFLGVFTFAAFGAVDLADFAAFKRWFAAVGARPSFERLHALMA